MCIRDRYQAQFDYEQYGEWQGTILRKTITPEGVVEHGENYVDVDGNANWDAAKKLSEKTSAKRKIWTVLGDRGSTHYHTASWNNWTTADANLASISDLFEELDNEVLDYHNTSSYCMETKNKTFGEDGTDDDVEGLINFVRGKDYFDYNGDCNITEDRAHMSVSYTHLTLPTILLV